jgi:tRNA 2-thiouridine synthesizing protein E
LLTPEHVEILLLARKFYAEYGFSPSMRPLIKIIGMNLSADKAHSIYLMKLFPQSPAKVVAKLAGLPKPKNCL